MATTAVTLAAYIGKKALWCVERSVLVEVTIQDARQSFGRLDVLVTPTKGEGSMWTSVEKCHVEDDPRQGGK